MDANSETDDTGDGDEGGVSRRRVLALASAAGLAGAGASGYFAGVAEAASGDAPFNAKQVNAASFRLLGRTTNQSPDSGYAAVFFRKDEV